MILMYHNTLDLNRTVGLLLIAFVWVLIKKTLRLKAWAEFLIASMYITLTSKEKKNMFITKSTKESFEMSIAIQSDIIKSLWVPLWYKTYIFIYTYL